MRMYFWVVSFLSGCGLLVFGEPLIGGHRVQAASYPYQVSLQNNVQHFCGGSIISKKWVLTAAHCMHKKCPKNVTVFAGSIYLHEKGDRYAVKLVKIHEDYNDVTQVNDIAAVSLHKSLAFSKNMQPSDLANSVPPTGMFATVTGWGYVNEDMKSIPDELHVLYAQIISTDECMKFNPLDRNYPDELVTNTNICVQSGSGEGHCQGDSGSALLYNGEQIGVVSFGADKCATGKPDVFTSVPYFRVWIKNTTGI